VSTTRDRAKILQIGRFIKFPSKFAAVGFLPTKERSFPRQSDKFCFYVAEFQDERKKGGTKKSNLFFATDFPKNNRTGKEPIFQKRATLND